VGWIVGVHEGSGVGEIMLVGLGNGGSGVLLAVGKGVSVGGITVSVGGIPVAVGDTGVLVSVGGNAVLVGVGGGEVGLGTAGKSEASPGKVSAASSSALVNPSPSESNPAIAAKAEVLRPLARYAAPKGFRFGALVWHRLHESIRLPLILGTAERALFKSELVAITFVVFRME
jgi:hypothetical protein